jgi:hypothetical protein
MGKKLSANEFKAAQIEHLKSAEEKGELSKLDAALAKLGFASLSVAYYQIICRETIVHKAFASG